MADTSPPMQHLPSVASSEAQVRLHEAAAGALRKFARSETIPVSRPVSGAPETALPATPAPAPPIRRTLGELSEELGLGDEDVPRPRLPAPRPASPRVVEGDEWSPSEVLRRPTPATAKVPGRSGASLAAGALAQMQIPKSR